MSSFSIEFISAREIIDSRGMPTIEVDVYTQGGNFGRASSPSGASTGKYEAVELRDRVQDRYSGKGVENAICHVSEIIAPKVKGLNCLDQRQLDAVLCNLDGTNNKSRLGANTTLAVSLAVARAASASLSIPLYRYLGGITHNTLPLPFVNIFNGGLHANNNIAIQEFMIVPKGAKSFSHSLQMCSEIFHCLKNHLNKDGFSTAVGDEGGFCPQLESIDQVFQYLNAAISSAGYSNEVDFALDVAASEFYRDRKYYLENDKKGLSTDQMIDYLLNLIEKYPICSIEDGLSEDDWDGFSKLNSKLTQKKVLLVGDDLLVTNCNRLQKAITQNSVSSILIKPNQIGTLTETLECIKLAHRNNIKTMISHRSGETQDSFISDLAVSIGSAAIKTGSICRGERTAKYNRLLRIEQELFPYSSFSSL